MKAIKYFWILAIISLSLQSCLDMEPLDQRGGDNMWTSNSDFQLFANNFYGWTRDFSSAVMNDDPHADKRSDLLMPYDGFNIYSHGTNTIPSSDGNYTGNYNNIRRTNLLLQNAENYGDKEGIKQYVGEAYFFRAYCYFDLLQLYGDAIIVKTPLDVTSPELHVSRNERNEVADFIIEDLNHAIENLPEFSSIGSDGNARVSKEAAQAFLSRVALYEGTWEKFRIGSNDERITKLLDIAAKSAKAVIDSKQFYLFGTEGKSKELGLEAQKYMFILENEQSNPKNVVKSDNHEYIFARHHSEALTPIGTNITKALLNNALWPTRKLADLYLCSDGLPISKSTLFRGRNTKQAEYENRDNRMQYTLLKPGVRYYSNAEGKYCTWTAEDSNRGDVFNPTGGTCYSNQKFCTERQLQDTKEGYDFPIIRYAEVLLNYAEAVYELHNSDTKSDNISDVAVVDDALNISLNLVRRRINPDMPALTVNFANTSGLSMREEIRRERTVELYMEGFRIDDLKRWYIATEEMKQDMLGVQKVGEYAGISASTLDPDGNIIVDKNRQWTEKNYLLPLPSDQLQLNTNLKQNPKW